MKRNTLKNYFLILFILIGVFSLKAQNLVLNPSFETFTPPAIIGCAGAGYSSVTNWYNPDPTDSCSTPDWYSNCTTLLGATPNAAFGYQVAHGGNAYAAFISKDASTTNYREYVEGKLSSPLTAGQQYCVSFYVSLADKSYLYCNNFGVYLSNSLAQFAVNNCTSTAPLPFVPQLNYTCTVTDTTNWVRLEWNYTAVGGEQYFTIGNFFNDASTTSGTNNAAGIVSGPFAYYYIDDVSIVPGACCAADIMPQPALCSTAQSVTLTATGGVGTTCTNTITGTWSGTGITNTTTGVFNPSVAGVGTHVISYSLSCGYVATTTITVNACATLTVCQSSGDLTVSGGTPTYTWSVWNPGSSTPITTQAQCTACSSSYTWVFGTCLNGITPVTSCITPAGWQQFATGATVTPPGTYPIKVDDGSSNSYTVTSLASTPTCAAACPTITVSTVATNSVSCFGASTGSATVAVSPVGTYTCTWLPGNLVGTSQSGLAAGIYTVTADAGGGCTGTTTVNIASAPSIVTTILSSATSCGLNNGYIDISTISGGTPNYTYSLNPGGSTSANTPNLAPGSYSLAITDANSCVLTTTINIGSSSPLAVSVNSATLCAGTTSATLTANGATTYSWSPAIGLSTTTGATVIATPTTTTIYTVTGISSSCSTTATSTVTIPTFTVNQVNLCKGDSALLIASNSALSYTWSPSTGLNNTNNDTVKTSPTTTTVYTISASLGTCSLTITDSVIVLTKPMIVVLSPTVCSATSATITATGASTYTWVPASNLTTSITSDTAYVNFPTTPGSYTVVGTAANGCKDTAVSRVTISNHLGILSATPITKCFGDYIGLSAVGASTYTWTSNNLANLDFGHDTGWAVSASVANVGTYTVAIYGESHTGTFCRGWDTITVTINPTPTVTVSGPSSFTVCAGSSATFSATSVAGPAAVTVYDWSPPTGLSSTSNSVGVTVATPPSSTNYTVAGYNQYGCGDYKNYNVTVIPIPTFNLNSASICIGSSATLTVTPTTSDAATYTWTPVSTLSTNTGTAVVASPTNTTTPTVYTVTATTNIAACPSLPKTTTVTVHPLPVISAIPTSTTICGGTTTNLTVTSGLQVYNWTPTSAINGSANTATVNANPTTATVYTVSGMDAFGCLSNTVTTMVNITNSVSSPSVAAVCKGQTINLMANAISGAAYTWTGPTYTSTPTSNTLTTIANSTMANSGTYTLSVVLAGCLSTNTVSVVVNPPPILTVAIASQTVCPNAQVTYTANGASTYAWSPATGLSATTGSIVTVDATTNINYNVVGTDVNGCSTSVTTTLVVSPVTAAIAATPSSGDMPLPVQFTNTSAGGIVYTWNYGNGSTTYTTTSLADANTNVVYTTPGTYTVTMTALNAVGCASTATLTVIVYEGYTLTIPNIFTPNGDGINDDFFVKSTGLASIEMVIYDRWGLKMWESSLASGQWDGKNAPDGTYFYIIKATSTKGQTNEYKGPLTLIK